MKLIASLLFLLSFSVLNAQENTAKKISYGFELQASYLTLGSEGNSVLDITGTFGTSLSGCVFISLKENLSFKTGLSFNQRTIRFKDFTPIFGSDIDNFGGVDLKNSWFQYDFPVFYLGLPAQVKWNLSENKNHFYVKAGAETYFKISSNESSHLFANKKKESDINANLDGFSSILLIAEMGIGYEFSLKNGKQFYIESNIEQALNSVFEFTDLTIENNSLNTTSPISTNGNYLNLGLAAGIVF